jgi:hypothetical protein
MATGSMAADVANFFMALLSFVVSAPGAYRLKAGNACSPLFNIDRGIPQMHCA